MCLAKICTTENTELYLADSITALHQTATEVEVTTLFGDKTTIKGQVLDIDFTNALITVSKS